MDSFHLKNIIMFKKEDTLIEALNRGWDPNRDGGWPIRLAARYGCFHIVEILIGHGANPHLLSDSGASTLQLAVFSGEHWETDRWKLLLSCCDSSQLADGAAVAIIFNNRAALQRILETGRCNARIPTSLTGKTLEQLAKGYKVSHLLDVNVVRSHVPQSADSSPHSSRNSRSTTASSNLLTPQHPQRNLSPSVARFFQQTAGQSSLSSPRPADGSSPTAVYLPNII